MTTHPLDKTPTIENTQGKNANENLQKDVLSHADPC